MLTLTGPITLLPVPCYFGVNIGGRMTVFQQTVLFIIGFFATLGKGAAVVFQFHYRIVQAVPEGSLFAITDFTKLRKRYYMSLYILAVGGVFFVLFVSFTKMFFSFRELL